MLSLQILPPSPGTTTRMVSGRCCAGQLREAAKKATESALDKAHQRTLTEAAATASRRADSIPALLLLVLVLAGLTQCSTTRATAPAEAHATTAEHAAPVNVRGWHEVDTLEE
ncbi:hypothetical protein Q5H92_08815 [Hymenobacter sp. M29]|uniref:Uncharacterized protein n=1 Tax=Hymenobacter mellowenesis TaxID=3063995 RepID=A0ABT9ABT5_9BACT|nr:hypothetical protein [Hymenobacter sp. M29]MDO7846456.1 hypothetical protein [Hymenobacter sp. M29]